MTEYGGLGFRDFRETDVEVFTPLMKRAFDEDTRRHLGEPAGGPPGYDNGDFLRSYALDPASTAWAVYHGDRPAGVLIAWVGTGDEGFLGNLFFDPDFQDRGFGLTAWRRLETLFPQVKVWRTETPGFSRRNHHFYINKCGFRLIRIEAPGDRLGSQFILEKRRAP